MDKLQQMLREEKDNTLSDLYAQCGNEPSQMEMVDFLMRQLVETRVNIRILLTKVAELEYNARRRV